MVVLDASAVLAFIYAESGHQSVERVLEDSRISAVNWSEVLQKIAFNGEDPNRHGSLLRAMGIIVEPLIEADAQATANLYSVTRHAGLSLGDRCCLATAERLDAPVLTADKAWAKLKLPLDIQLVR